MIATNFTSICFSFYESYFWKHLFLFRGFLIKKTTFSYFPGMFENPAPTKLFKKNQKYYEISTIFTNASKNNRWLLFIISEWFVYDPSWMFSLMFSFLAKTPFNYKSINNKVNKYHFLLSERIGLQGLKLTNDSSVFIFTFKKAKIFGSWIFS